MLKKAIRARYTLEFKQEAVRMAEAEGSIAKAARSLGLPGQTLSNCVKVVLPPILSAHDNSRMCCHAAPFVFHRADVAQGGM